MVIAPKFCKDWLNGLPLEIYIYIKKYDKKKEKHIVWKETPSKKKEIDLLPRAPVFLFLYLMEVLLFETYKAC